MPVILHAQIGKDGNVRIGKARMDEVKQWKYTPYMINGELSNVDTTLRVNFTLN